MQASRTARAPLAHAWLFDLLFAAAPTVTWAEAGALPAGFELADQFAVLPAGRGRSFMVSLAARRGTSSALTSYNSLRSGRTRIARRVLGLGLRTGLAQPLLRNKVDVGIASAATPAQLAEELLGEHLEQLFGPRPCRHSLRRRQRSVPQAGIAGLQRDRDATRLYQGGLE